MKKRGYELSFSWIFAMVAGALIIFLAIYVTTQIIGIERFGAEAQTGKTIGILLDPIATNLEEAKTAQIIVNDETKIFNTCSNKVLFGTQQIATSVRQGNLGDAWPETTGPKISFRDRYIFSNKEIHGQERFYVFSKPFEFPFKVADVMFLWSDKEPFCFVGTPNDIIEEIEDLNLENIKTADCTSSDTVICFPGAGRADCQKTILPDKRVRDEATQKTVSYIETLDRTDKNTLLYAAIFSDPEIYECQLDRIMQRTAALANVYTKKAQGIFTQSGCGGSRITNALDALTSATATYTDSNQLTILRNKAEKLKNENPISCKIF